MQMHTLLSGFLALLGLYILGFSAIALISYQKMFIPAFNTLDHSLSYALENGETDADFVALPWETVHIDSPRRGSHLEALVLPAAEPSPAGIAVFVHGITWTRYGMLKYMGPFVDSRWHVVAPDLPGHGGSPQGTIAAPAFGYQEKHDLGATVDWSRQRFGMELPVVLIGESMGAATVLQYAPLAAPAGAPRSSWKVSAVVADCSYSSAEDELRARLADMGIPSFLARPALPLVSALLRARRGYGLGDPSPERAVLETELPILFIHGSEDSYVPTRMSVRMAELRRASGAGPTELLVVEGARHAKSVLVDPTGWFAAVFAFIEKYAEYDKKCQAKL